MQIPLLQWMSIRTKKAIIEGWLEGMQPFIDEVHPYDEQDVGLLKKMFGMDISLKTASGRSEETK